MSHLLEEYSKNLGVKIAKPIVAKHFWPLNHDKFITICVDHKIPSKHYKYYDIVLDIIKKHLQINNIKVVQIGTSDSPKIKNVDERIFDIPFKNFAYVISKSQLHIGVDNHFMHYASSINLPLITLFGNVFPAISRGYWSNNQICIEAPWKKKPCFGPHDADDAINKIKPEEIANAILKQLKIKASSPLKTKFIGDYYHNQVIELIPDFFEPVPDLQNQHVFIRADYKLDDEYLVKWTQYLNNFSLFLNQGLPLTFLKQLRGKLKHISLVLTDDIDQTFENYFASIKSLGIGLTILVDNPDLVNILREKFFDFDVHPYFKASKKDLDDSVDFSKDIFNSSKLILAGGKKYCSKYHWLQQKNFVDKNFNLEDNEILLEELNHFYIYGRTT